MSEKDIEQLIADTVGNIASTMPQYDPNPVRTASWNIRFIDAVIAGANWVQAESTAWARWREAMGPQAAEAYNQAISEGKTTKHAMTIFWSRCRKDVPRPQQAIASIAGSNKGLVLDGGRVIDWYIAKLKIQKDELDLNGDVKPRLLKRLQELNYGQSIWPLLK